jgi:hypothetical protein
MAVPDWFMQQVQEGAPELEVTTSAMFRQNSKLWVQLVYRIYPWAGNKNICQFVEESESGFYSKTLLNKLLEEGWTAGPQDSPCRLVLKKAPPKPKEAPLPWYQRRCRFAACSMDIPPMRVK